MDLLEALDAAKIPYKVSQSREGQIALCCPFCESRGETPDTRFRLGINYIEGLGHCFNCGKGWVNGERMLRELERKLETGELELAALGAQAALAPARPVELPEDFQLIQYGWNLDSWNRVAYEYVKRRGVMNWQIKAHQIGFSLVGDFRYRIVLPIYNGEKLIGLVGRAFVKDLEPKYRNALGEKPIYNLPNQIRHTAIITEGAFDALAVERYAKRFLVLGQPANSLAALGHSLTTKQLEQLENYECFILWPDPDEVGVRGFLHMGRQLEIFRKPIRFVAPQLGSAKEYDPSELWDSEISKVLRNTEPFTDELVQRLENRMVFMEE